MRYDTKIAIAVRDDLASWQKLNVTAFLAGGLVGAHPDLPGEPYRDGSGRVYGPLVRQPILIFAGSGEALARALARARERELPCCLYTRDLFATGNDADNRAAVARVATEDLDLVGLALHADRKAVDKVMRDMVLHP
ncbi:conserved hypothetical protein [Methylobacterium sp. 4-46]|uniref:DUF2000 family protein n=1 Tax=unclassified Methylobacterium TaxID=2615210 RepID=UPI000165C57C|nr:MULTISPECIES: DUF2000 family protein [Methylobacterium]ACA15181.1 conserved hypothetical protein [Methylobacterium sp. 4-46]WFT80913.1 DUF2000 family protein [Methylobacterium nodulans]